METFNIGTVTALVAGILSFASPCVLPIVPGYLSFITGLGLEDLMNREKRSSVIRKAVLSSIVFVLGFSIIFILLGASATVAGAFMRSHLGLLSSIAGVLIVVLGVHMTGIVRIPFLMYEKRMHGREGGAGIGKAFIAGLVFSFGWTPCIGPILAGILAMASVQESATRGIFLLSVYSIGLGVPFILSALFLNSFFSMFSKFKHHLRKVEIAGGAILIAIGILMFTGNLSAISQRLEFLNPESILESGKTEVAAGAGPAVSGNVVPGNVPPADTVHEAVLYNGRDFSLKTLGGREIRLSDYAGKHVLVNIWAPWCGPCRLETPDFVRLYKEYHGRGFEIISVAVQTNEADVREFVGMYGVTWAVGLNDEVASSYGTYGLPDNYLFGPDGSLVKHFVGLTREDVLKPVLDASMKQHTKNTSVQ